MAGDGTRDDPPPTTVDLPSRADGSGLRLVPTRASVREEFLDLYEAHYTKVVCFVMLACSATKEAAEEAAQEAFVEAWEKVCSPAGWGTVRRPPAWLRTIARRRYQRPGGVRSTQPPTVRGASPEHLPGLFAPHPGPDDLATVALDLLNALRSLPGDDIRAVMAFTLDGFSDREIAEQLGTDPQRVRNLRAKARRLLGPALRAYHREGDGR